MSKNTKHKNSITDKQLAKMELVYANDHEPGFTRKKLGKSFRYFDLEKKLIKNKAEINRINKLAIPPAYKNVWICANSHGHLQATGIDARGRKQYRYHPDWRKHRDQNKFQHIIDFAETLPKIRSAVQNDMKLHGLPRKKALATVVMLLEKTLIRVGNAEYARENASYGLTTLHNKHVDVTGSKIRFRFKGKSGKHWNLSITDARIAKVIKNCADIKGQELFKYVDEEGNVHDVTSGDVNAYLQEITEQNFTAKDFRTWSGTVLAAMALKEYQKYDSATEAKKNIVAAIESVSKKLGNTPAICRKCYIHPHVLNSYLDGSLVKNISKNIDKTMRDKFEVLSDDEVLVLVFLKRALEIHK